MERRRVVITGLGAVTPIGLTAGESWQAVKNGVCGIGPITHYDPAAQKVKLAAEVKGFDPEALLGRQESKRMGRFTQFAVAAAREALSDAGFSVEQADADRCGVILSSGIGGQAITEAEHSRGQEKGFDRVSPFYVPTAICNMAAGQVAIDAGFRAMCSCPVTACAGGTNAVGDAFHYIRDGYAEVMLCGGTEASITPMSIGGFTSMKALTQTEDPDRASIPFDASAAARHGRGRGRAASGGIGTRQDPRGEDLRRGGGLRRHLRRSPHHRPPCGRQRRRQSHGHGADRRRRCAGARWVTSTPTAPLPTSTMPGRPPRRKPCSVPTPISWL